MKEIDEPDTCRQCGAYVPGAGNLCLCDSCIREQEAEKLFDGHYIRHIMDSAAQDEKQMKWERDYWIGLAILLFLGWLLDRIFNF